MSKEKAETRPAKETAIAPRDPFPALFAAPFPSMRRFVEDFERMFNDFGAPFGLVPWRPVRDEKDLWVPNVELRHRNGEFVVKVDLPGLEKKDVKVEIVEGGLVIEGERKQEKEEKGEGFYRSEFSYGRFTRTVALPEGAEAGKARATFTNGVLEIVMPAPARKAPEGRVLEIAGPAEKAKTAA